MMSDTNRALLFSLGLCAKAGSKAYGAITASIAYYGEAERLFTVPAHDFVPAPKVNSAVVRIRLYGDQKPNVPQTIKLSS